MADDFDLDGYMGELSEGDDSSTHITSKAANANWVPDEALANLVEERTFAPEKDNMDIAKTTLDQNAPLAVQSIVNLAMYSKSDSVRLRASAYIIDKAFDSKAAGSSILEQFLDGVEKAANANSNKAV